MINRIVDFSVENKLLVIVAAAMLCILGWWSMTRVPLDAIPDLGEKQVIILSKWDRSPDVV